MNGRDKFVVAWMVLLFFVSWSVSLGRLIGTHFWDRRYNIQEVATEQPTDPVFLNSTASVDIGTSYFSKRRYIFFFPHVVCAILWWNLYFFQLIPSIRRKYKWFHRYLGRSLMVVVLIQVWSGFGLATTSHSSTIKIVSWVLALAILYCVIMAWKYAAIYKDIPKHKYWVTRLVGYLQTIALQRFWLVVFIISHQSGWTGLYPAITEDTTMEETNAMVYQMFDDSFVLCILHAILTTEWYLSAEIGMHETKPKEESTDSALPSIATPGNAYGSTSTHENQALLPVSDADKK